METIARKIKACYNKYIFKKACRCGKGMGMARVVGIGHHQDFETLIRLSFASVQEAFVHGYWKELSDTVQAALKQIEERRY